MVKEKFLKLQNNFNLKMLLSSLKIIFILFSIQNCFGQNNIVINGDFESGLNEWDYWADNSLGYNANLSLNSTEVYAGNNSAEFSVSSIGADANPYKVMVRNTSFSLELGKTYNVSFFLKSVAPQDFLVQVHRNTSPYTSYFSDSYSATNQWQQYTFEFQSPVNTSDVRFTFKLGNGVNTFYFDNVEIVEQTPIVYNELIDSNYSIDWRGAGVQGGIPQISNVLDVSDFGAIADGITDNYAAFSNAFQASLPGQAIFVPQGDYKIIGSINIPEGVVLRGACPSNTKLLIDVGNAESCINLSSSNYGNYQSVISGFEKGSQQIIVQDASNISVGDYAQMRQENDSLLMYTDINWIVSWAEYSVGQIFKITSINGNVLTFDRPINYGFNANLNPEIRPIYPLQNAGIENIFVERLDANNGHTINFSNAANCWLRNVESNMTYRSHVNIEKSIDCEVRDSYFHHSHDYGGGGHGYGANLIIHATNCLIENNIFETLRHAMLIQVGANGNVFAYNYSVDPFWSNSTTNIPPDISMHGHYPVMNLFEGNIVQEAAFSDFWGPVGPGNTMFRNRVEQSNIYVNDYSHNQNIIANELTGSNNILLIDPSVNETWAHSNNLNGSLMDTVNFSIPASLYLDEFPDFLTGYAFPAIGSDVYTANNSIPAKVRFDSGIPMMACYCDSTVICNACPEVINDSNLGGGFPQMVLNGEYYTSDSIISSGIISTGTSVRFSGKNKVILNSGFETGNSNSFEADNIGCEN